MHLTTIADPPHVSILLPEVVLARLGFLGIRPQMVRDKTLTEIQHLVKKRYHILCLKCHPDRGNIRSKEQRGLRGFQDITKLYKWFMALTEADIAVFSGKQSSKEHRRAHARQFGTVPDSDMPLNMDRAWLHSMPLPWGYHETTDYLAYQ